MKYIMENTPANGAGAFMPPMLTSPKSHTYGMVKVVGHPGNLGVPSPKPEWTPAGPLVRSAQPSYNSPDVFAPSIYYTTVSDMHPADNTVRVRSTNELPIPAKRYTQVPLVAFSRPRVGGLRQVTWPPAPMAWQNINSGAVSG